ncbi:ferritin-like domain-containing protein [Gillisia sp. JM1]|uniref:ferritin-like domain-containing protein n=1 Tax=Gillisia sp. JM1 TaxID=1283286 RepID=UPI000402E12C|nr:ferritin-like domain-containing protein [Gillisia sp. JM1]
MKRPVIKVEVSTEAHSKKSNSRRQFLKMGSLAVVGSSLFLYGCNNDDDSSGPITPPPGEAFDLGAGNLGILNYAYALEQLEAEFYTQVVAGSYYTGLADGSAEKTLLEDVWYHEIIHREFFKTAITAVAPNDILPDLEFDFSSVDFSSRASVLGTSLVLEDTGVSAYNGAGQLIDVTAPMGGTYLLLAGKIVSVEARHASAFADLINPGSADFARDGILVNEGGTGLAYDKALPPSEVLAAVGNTGFVTTPFTADQLPTS